MPRRGYSPRHSGLNHPVNSRARRRDPRRSVRAYRITLIAAFIALIPIAAMIVIDGTVKPATSAATDIASCAGAPTLTADTSTDTLLGVNATSPSQLQSATSEFGRLPVLRVYYTGMPDPNAWTTGVQAINHSAVVLSFRSPPATVLSGADDAALTHFFDTAPTGHPIYYSYYHEPELLVQAGTFTVSQYRQAWAHIAAIADAAHNPYLKSTLILMTWDLDPASGIRWLDYLPPGNVISTLGWDAYPAGTVSDRNPQPTPPADFMGGAEAASRSVGLPFGFAEFALGTQADRPHWLAQVASYLRSSGALFGTLFNSTGFPWMELKDAASIQAWRAAVAGSGSGAPGPGPSSPPVSSPQPGSPTVTIPPSPAPSAAPDTSPDSVIPSASATTVAPQITGVRVDPKAFVPTGTNRVRIQVRLSRPASIAICVMGRQGTVLGQIDRPDRPAGWSLSWYFGRDATGDLLPGGHYPVVIVASNSAGSASARAELTINSG
jgi:hypothetical protein